MDNERKTSDANGRDNQDELSMDALDEVAGGFNPQPEPPLEITPPTDFGSIRKRWRR